MKFVLNVYCQKSNAPLIITVRLTNSKRENKLLYSFGGLFSRFIHTGEDLIHMGGVGLEGEKAYQRDEDNIEYHHDSARVYGRVESQPADGEVCLPNVK